MFLIYFLLAILGCSVAQSENQRDLQSLDIKSNFFESSTTRKILNERPNLSDFNLITSQQDNNSQGGNGKSKSLINGNVIAILIHELIKTSSQSSKFPTLVATNISKKCHDDSQAYYDANLLFVNWANQMFESNGKFPEGLFSSGNVHASGLFDECINVKAEWTNTSFQGHYCTVFLDTALVMPSELADETEHTTQNPMQRSNWLTVLEALMLQYNGPTLKQPKIQDTNSKSKFLPSADFCIPSSCSMEDFRTSVAQLIGSRAIGNITIDGKFYYTSIVTITDEKFCYTKEKINTIPSFDGPDIAMLVALSLVGLLIFLATAREFWLLCSKKTLQSNKNGISLNALHCFSMTTNCRILLSTKSAVVENLSCLNGIRVLSTAWIVLYHSYYLAGVGYYPMYNGFMLYQDSLTCWQVHGVINATVAVNTFFLMSALLVTYSLLRELDRNKGRFNLCLFYLHRYLRLTLVYAFILGFIASLLC